MRIRSTGLGKTELEIEVEGVVKSKEGDYVILLMRTLEPVRWRIRAAVTWGDLVKIIILALKSGRVIGFMLSGFRRRGNKIRPPGEF